MTTTTQELLAKVARHRHEHKMRSHYGHQKNATGLDGVELGPLADNLIGFFEERDVLFLGEDATRAHDLIHAAARRIAAEDPVFRTGGERGILSRIEAGRVTLTEQDGVPCLRLWATDWNDWLLCLYSQGTGFSALQKDGGDPPEPKA